MRKSREFEKKKNDIDAKNNVIILVSNFKLKNCKISHDFLKDFIKDRKKITQFFRIKNTKSRDFETKFWEIRILNEIEQIAWLFKIN